MKNLKPFVALAILASLTLSAVQSFAVTMPDLVATNIALDQNGYIKVRISNLGTAAGASKVRVWHRGQSQMLDVPALPACTYGTPFIQTNIKCYQGWDVLVVPDFFDQILESDEANARSFSTSTLPSVL